MNGLALLWVAIEVTTVVSALLVAIDDTDGAIEAAGSTSSSRRWAWASLFSPRSSCTTPAPPSSARLRALLREATRRRTRFPPDVVRLSFVLAVLGFGTKMGLVPVHTWLPDAHSEAPTPVSALLSGAVLAISFYAILRSTRWRSDARTGVPRDVLLVFGLASLLLAALYLRARETSSACSPTRAWSTWGSSPSG